MEDHDPFDDLSVAEGAIFADASVRGCSSFLPAVVLDACYDGRTTFRLKWSLKDGDL